MDCTIELDLGLTTSGHERGANVNCAKCGPDDPRPSDPAQLAREVARELRKIHGIRAMQSGKRGVYIGQREPYYYDMASKEEWTQLGPITIAAEIKKLECARAMRDAGDA